MIGFTNQIVGKLLIAFPLKIASHKKRASLDLDLIDIGQTFLQSHARAGVAQTR